MYAKAGYYSYDESGICDMNIPVRIVSCGIFKPISRPDVLTIRTFGRKDYQFIYVASGKVYFVVKEDEASGVSRTIEVEEGNGFLYRPGQKQHYYYRSCENTSVYWMHFTGYKAIELINECKV